MNYVLLLGLVCVCVLITSAAPPPKDAEDNSESYESHEQSPDCGHKHHHHPHPHHHGRAHNHRHHPHHHRHHHHHQKGHRHGHWNRRTNQTTDSSEEHSDVDVLETTTIHSAPVHVPSSPPAIFSHSLPGGADSFGTFNGINIGLDQNTNTDTAVHEVGGADNFSPSGGSNNGLDHNTDTAVHEVGGADNFGAFNGINNEPDQNTDTETAVHGVDTNPSIGADQLGTNDLMDFNGVASGVSDNSPASSAAGAEQSDPNTVYVSGGVSHDAEEVVSETTTEHLYDVRSDSEVDVVKNIKINLNHPDPE